MIDTLWQDLKYAARSLRRTPGFAAAAIVTLALGIGANTAIFTLLDAVMFKPLNVPAPHDLVALYEQPREGDVDATGGTGRFTRFSYRALRRRFTRFVRTSDCARRRSRFARGDDAHGDVRRPLAGADAAAIGSRAARLGRLLFHARRPASCTGAPSASEIYSPQAASRWP